MTRLIESRGAGRSLPREIPQGADRAFRSAPTGLGEAEVPFASGMTALRDGHAARAVGLIGKAIVLDPANSDFRFILGAAYDRLGQADRAEASYRQALRLRPDFAEAAHALGKLLADRGDLERAAESYRLALEHRPDAVEPHAALGSVMEALGREEEAVAAYEKTVRLQPDHLDSLKALGTLNARRGRLDEAVMAYRQWLRLRPGDPEAHNELGIIQARQGRFDEAAVSYQHALSLEPNFADAHNNLGNSLRQLRRLDEALECFYEALRIRPLYPECHNNLGIALRQKGKLDEAIACYQSALRMRPNYAEAHNNLGIALAARGRPEGAVACFQHALRIRPDYIEARSNLANSLADLGRLEEAVQTYRDSLQIRPDDPKLHKNLGIVLSKLNRHDDAEAAYREALRLRPNFADAHNDLGISLSKQDRYEEAIVSYQEALHHRPNYAEVYNNLGNVLRNSGRFAESLDSYHQAVKLRPNYADAYNNLGIAYAELGRFDDAVESYTKCLRLRPNHVDAHLNRALTWLRQGDFAQGWAEYEWRWRKRPHLPRTVVQPLWNGASVAGRRILLLAEQGFGDTFQFVRYAEELRDRGATVILECPAPVLKLMSRVPGIDRAVTRDEPSPDHDVYCPLLSLPGLMGSSADTFPAKVPYIHPEPELVERWRSELNGIPGFKVGISWQGNRGYAGDRHRSMRLEAFEPLSRLPGVTLISLQKNFGAEQLADIGGRFPVVDLGACLDQGADAFMETAAVMKSLDLFITCDTALGHLAGALDVPTWLALSSTPDWRWLTEREDTPWYPRTRLFRQSEPLTWGPVFERMAAELRNLVGVPSTVHPIVAEIAPGELLDKITILQIKLKLIGDPEKLRNVRAELAVLEAARERAILAPETLTPCIDELKAVNRLIWQVEDDIRALERVEDFGPRFIELARSVYKSNDLRAAIKRRINTILGSALIEEKSHEAVTLGEFALTRSKSAGIGRAGDAERPPGS